MRDHNTPNRQRYLERIQHRTTIRELLLVGACGAFMGWLLAQFI